MDNVIESQPVKHTGPLSIIIVDNRGLTFVGRVDWETTIHGLVCIRDARCVIRWGTSQHLAELAESGPTENTVLGAARDVFVANIVALYECSGEWI